MVNIQDLNNIKVFFIIGRPRSGTTLLRLLFDAHPNISLPFEGKVITEQYLKFRNIKKWDTNKLLDFYESTFMINKVNLWRIDKDKLKSEILSLGENANLQNLIKLVYINAFSPYKKEKILLIGDKNPHYSISKNHLKIIKKVFPESKVIHLTRDYRDHYLSMMKMDFEANYRGLISVRWRNSYKLATKMFAKNTDTYYKIKYEDLVSNPEKYMTEMLEFIGLYFNPEILEFYKIESLIKDDIDYHKFMKFHSKLLNPISNKYIYGWKTKMTNQDVKYFDNAIGNVAELAGYDRVFKSNKWFLLNWHFFLYNKLIFTATYILDLLPYKLRNKLSPKRKLSAIYFKFLKR